MRESLHCRNSLPSRPPAATHCSAWRYNKFLVVFVQCLVLVLANVRTVHVFSAIENVGVCRNRQTNVREARAPEAHRDQRRTFANVQRTHALS